MTPEDIITPEGLKIPTVEDLKNEISDELHATVDPTLDVSPESPEGQMMGIFCSHMREAYETLAVVANIRPEDTEGFMADFVSAITGTRREGATRTRFVGTRKITVSLDDGTTLPIGSVVSVDGDPDTRVETTEEVSNTGPTPADFQVAAQCTEFGPISIYANTLTVIATPISGWTAVNNSRDGETGQLEESDAALLARRERELRKPGTATQSAIEVDLLSIVYEGQKLVEEATCFRNNTMSIDVRGLPPKSVECLVFDGLDAALPDTIIAQQIHDSIAAGIQSFGGIEANVLDSKGNVQTERFSRPTLLDAGAQLTITYNAQRYIGDDALAIKIADFMKTRAKSEALLRWSDVVQAAGNLETTGVTGVQEVIVYAFSADPFVDFQMPMRSYPLWDSSGILIDSSPG